MQTDVNISGLGGGLRLSRTWNSLWPSSESMFQTGIFGVNWRSSFEERIYVSSNGYVTYSRGDGGFWSFAFTGYALDGVTDLYTVVSPANGGLTLSYDDNNWTLTNTRGEKKIFDHIVGNLHSIVDRYGNTTQLSYDGLNRLVTITDPASRHLYFGYPDASTYLVTSVTSDFGVSLSYVYDNQKKLIKVSKSDGTVTSFEYDSNSRIIAVKDSRGKILEAHTYDALGRGLTSSRANGVEAITVAYPQ